MPTFNIFVKWGKEKFEVQCNTDDTPELLMAQLFALSGVPPDRQKLLGKGVNVKDNVWNNSKIKEGMTMMMMGSADELPKVPVEATKFVEDMTDDQLAQIREVPSGLQNLGNTCYMNATLQCLKSVPELRDALASYKSDSNLTIEQNISGAIRDLFNKMKHGGSSVPPFLMLSQLHSCFPQFSTTGEGGGYEQQDANECWIALVRCLQKEVPLSSQVSENMGNGSFIDKYFSGEFAIDMKCVESDEEPVSQTVEPFSQLSCFIDKEVKYLASGLKSRLEEHIEKRSPTLGKNAQYIKTSKINRLPAYVTIQMVRFFYKEKEQVNAKILKDIKFPLTLDLHDLCTDELKSKQSVMRNNFKSHEDKMALTKSKAQGKVEKIDDSKFATIPYSFADDVGSNNSGYYELQAVLTHKGRSSSSGHYVAWTRFEGDEWLKFDDDHVTSITSEEIVKLSGGGDWHCAYILLYGPRQLKVDEGDSSEDTAEVDNDKMKVDC